MIMLLAVITLSLRMALIVVMGAAAVVAVRVSFALIVRVVVRIFAAGCSLQLLLLVC